MGSFYLVNLILAIVAMSYDDCQKQELEEEKAEAMVKYLQFCYTISNDGDRSLPEAQLRRETAQH